MIRTVEAIIDEDSMVHLAEVVQVEFAQRALVTILESGKFKKTIERLLFGRPEGVEPEVTKDLVTDRFGKISHITRIRGNKGGTSLDGEVTA